MTPADDAPLILCAEDEDALRRDILEELHEAGYRVLQAADGKQALEVLASATPDLVLCDISMPELDGYDFLKTLRRDRPELARVPFIFLTALAEPREVIEGKLAGADDYLVKPVDYDLMLATISTRLRQVARIRQHHDRELSGLRAALSGLSGGGAEQALDLIAVGIVLLDGAGQLLYANRTASEMSREADIIQIRGDGVRVFDPISGRSLQQALSETLTAAKAGEDKVIGVLLQCAEAAGTVSALACALPHQGGGASGAPSVALFLSSPDRRARVPQGLLMELFGLTPTEARVAGALANGARPVEVAAELGVSQTTIAYHMRNLFQKTGTNRQADLVALILAGPMVIKAE